MPVANPGLSNSIDRTKNYLQPAPGPSSQAAQHTTNPNGATTARNATDVLTATGAQYGETAQRLSAVNGSAGFNLGQAGADPAVLAAGYRRDALDAHRYGTPGGENQIQRADKLMQSSLSLAGAGMNQRRVDDNAQLGKMFGESEVYQPGTVRQPEVRKFTSDHTGGTAYIKMKGDKFALTSKDQGLSDSQMEDIKYRREQSGERLLTDSGTQKRGLETAIRRGSMNAAAKRYLDDQGIAEGDYLNPKTGRVDRGALTKILNSRDSAVANTSKPAAAPRKLPSGDYQLTAQHAASADSKAMAEGETPQDSDDFGVVSAMGLQDATTYGEFAEAMKDKRKMSNIAAMDDDGRYAVGRAIARSLRNALTENGKSFTASNTVSSQSEELLDEAQVLDLEDKEAVNEWFHNWTYSVYDHDVKARDRETVRGMGDALSSYSS